MVLSRNPTAGRTALVALLLILMAASAAHAQAPRIDQATLEEPNQKTREVSTAELKRTLANKTAVVLDARPYREFAMSHVPGAQNVAAKPGIAISMYVSDVKEVERLVDGDKSKPLILYCNGPFCGKSKRLSEELLAAGFTTCAAIKSASRSGGPSVASPRSSWRVCSTCFNPTGPRCSSTREALRSSEQGPFLARAISRRAPWSPARTSVR
jgi:rhodanese-related sulfurtransferase